jgi:membrane protease YdiL (CAAX protease family)
LTGGELAWAMGWVAGGAWLVRWLFRSGALSARAFDRSPARLGRLGWLDLAVTAGLFLIAPLVFVGAVFGGGANLDFDAVKVTLWWFLCAQGGMAVAAIHAVYRASLRVEGGLAGWGLSWRGLSPSVGRAEMAMFILFPLALAMSSTMVLLLHVLGLEAPVMAHATLEILVKEEPSAAWWGLIGSQVVLAALLEEIIFRGQLQTSLRHMGVVKTRWAAIAWTSVVFSLVHLSTAEPQALPVLYVLSVGLGWAYERWGSLWVPIFMHGLFNALQITLAAWIAPPGPPH